MICLVFYRYGRLIRQMHYLCDSDKVEILPRAVGGLIRLVESQHNFLVHTKLSGVGWDYFSLAYAVACNDAMLEKVGSGDGLFEDKCVCPEESDQDINYRKPYSKYGFEILKKYGKSLQNICYADDNVTNLLQALLEQGENDSFPVFDCFLDAKLCGRLPVRRA